MEVAEQGVLRQRMEKSSGCKALVHNDTLVLPYAVSDSASTVATLSLTELLNQLTKHSRSCPLPERRMEVR